jgi:hypothetical protein
MVITSIAALIIVLVITSVSVSCCYDIGVTKSFKPMISPLFAAVTLMTRIVSMLMLVLFIIAAWVGFPYMVFAISLACGDLHELG